MELAEVRQPSPLPKEQASDIAETDLSQSMLTVHSKSVSEIAQDENTPEENLHTAPGNLMSMMSPDDGRSTPTKKLTIIDDDHPISSVTSLKDYHKLQHGRQKKKRNKVAPTDVSGVDLDRPSSAPSTNNRTRQWLKEINENRPMTAAPMLSRAIIPTHPQKVSAFDNESFDHQSLKDSVAEDAVSVASTNKKESHDSEPLAPAVNETAYIPYDYARSMISRIVEDMNKMKASHLLIITSMENEYQKMEKHTQVQFNDCVLHLQDRHKQRIEHYRHIIEVLHAELQSKGSLRNEVIQNLKERNEELALERKKIQHQLSRSQLQFVPLKSVERGSPEAKRRKEEDAESIEEKSEAEEKVEEESEEEKEIPGALVLAGVAAVAELEDVVREKDEEDKEKQESDLDDDQAKYEIDEETDTEIVNEGVDVVLIKEGTGVSLKEELTKTEEKKKPEKAQEKKRAKSKASLKAVEPVSSAGQAQHNKQQALLATKQAKRVKELERQLEAERRRVEQNRKSAKNVDADLENAKSELGSLKKTLAEQKAELTRLEEAAGAGTIALQQLPSLKEEIKTLSVENETLVTNYNSERVLRKKYYNMVEDMKGKIRVYCRVRPLSKTEKANKNKCAVYIPDEYTVKIEMKRGGMKEFQFDEIFTETAAQENIFEDTNSLIQSAVDGYNVCIFAYGQTGSGKTYTMIGDNDQKSPGIAPRAFNRIFEIAEKNKKKFTFEVSCYMLELYNEKLVDLLSVGKGEPAKLDIKKDNKGMVVIQGTAVLRAETSNELFDIFLKGSLNRHTASTKMNEDSSRSHLVVGVIVESTNLTSGAITRGKLSLVDLAGSERVAKTGATAQQLKEANSINKSLSALGDVISALSSEQSFIPYRNNKLTMLMQDSLGGNAKTLMFVNISPADYNSDESATSLTYASRVKLITNDATKMADSKEVARLKQVIAKLKAGEQIDE